MNIDQAWQKGNRHLISLLFEQLVTFSEHGIFLGIDTCANNAASLILRRV
jgi:hypothetical protein